MYIELIGERVLCVCFVLRVHCTFDGDGGSKLQSRSCLSCVFSIIVSNMHFFQMFSICSRVQGSHNFFTFKFKDFSRLNRSFSRSHQCKIPGLFQVKLMFFATRKPKLIRIMHLNIATCKLL